MTSGADFFVEADADGVDGRHFVEYGRCVRMMYPVDILALGLALLNFAPALANVDELKIEDFGRALVAMGMKAISERGRRQSTTACD